jgi:hypothetical protein
MTKLKPPKFLNNSKSSSEVEGKPLEPYLDPSVLSNLITSNSTNSACSEEELKLLLSDDDQDRKRRRRVTTKPRMPQPILKPKHEASAPIQYTPSIPADPRLFYPRHLMKGFNSCDAKVLRETLQTYCEENVLGIYRYDGIQNPYGTNFRECEGIESKKTSIS